MLFALTSRTRFFPELAEAGYRCFETEPCDDVRVGVATLRCGPHPFVLGLLSCSGRCWTGC